MSVCIFDEDIACEFVDKPVLQIKDVCRIFSCSEPTASKYLKKGRELKRERGIKTYHESVVPANLAFEAWHMDLERLRKLKKLKTRDT